MPRIIAPETDPGLPGRLKAARKAAGKTLADIAAETGLTLVMINRYECGRGIPRAHRLPALAAAYDTTVAFILGQEDDLDAYVQAVIDALEAEGLDDVQRDALAQALRPVGA